MKISNIIDNSQTNGEGTRMVIFFSGCDFDCKGCHNEEAKDINSGKDYTIEEITKRIKNNIPIISGVTLSGGDPFKQAKSAYLVAATAKFLGLDVWTYTGNTKEEILSMSKIDDNYKNLVFYSDVIVDGRFVEDLKDESLEYKGSSNQRILNVRKEFESIV